MSIDSEPSPEKSSLFSPHRKESKKFAAYAGYTTTENEMGRRI